MHDTLHNQRLTRKAVPKYRADASARMRSDVR